MFGLSSNQSISIPNKNSAVKLQVVTVNFRDIARLAPIKIVVVVVVVGFSFLLRVSHSGK
ncbi:hypothetical protein ACHAXS_013961 [Conticribra weissflogii]